MFRGGKASKLNTCNGFDSFFFAGLNEGVHAGSVIDIA
jgi:hypothetical protein